MCANIEVHSQENKPINFFKAYRCFSLDGITSYCFGSETNAVSAPDFDFAAERAMYESTGPFALLKHFRPLVYLSRYIPESVISLINPSMVGLVRLFKVSLQVLRTIVRLLNAETLRC